MAAVARVARSLFPTLSRSWRSTFPSPLPFSVRSDHVHFHSHSHSSSQSFLCINTNPENWYLFDILHHQNPSPVIALPPPPIATIGSCCVAIGHILFVFGGRSMETNILSTDIQIFDTRLYRWSFGPRMNYARFFLGTGVINGRIYAVGSSNQESDPWAEVLDPKLGMWTTVPTPPHARDDIVFPTTAVLGGKLLLLFGRGGGVLFDPEAEAESESAWSNVPKVIDEGIKSGVMVVVDEVLFSLDSRFIEGYGRDRIRGYDPTTGKWKPLEGWDKEFPDHRFVCLTNVEGVLCVTWVEERGSCEKENMIVGIKVSRKSDGRFMGSIVWPESALPPFLQHVRIHDSIALEL